MKLSQQVITLDQAKRLKELGIKQDSYFLIGEEKSEPIENWSVEGTEDTFYAAFTVAELGEMLQHEDTTLLAVDSHYVDHQEEWVCNCYKLEDWDGEGLPPILHIEEGDTEAEVRGAMLVYLLENEFITSQSVNDRMG